MKYWLLWQVNVNKIWLVDWQKNKLGTQAAQAFFPWITELEAKNTVLMECHEKQEPIERDISNQTLPNLSLAKLGFVNVWIEATPLQDELFGDCIRCVYSVEEK
jgi:hypothetical protein